MSNTTAIDYEDSDRPYAMMGLNELGRTIRDLGCRRAAEEALDHRTLFEYRGRRLTLRAYLEAMSCTERANRLACGREDVLLAAQALTYDKFANLPADGPRKRGAGPNGRLTWGAWIDAIERHQRDHPGLSELEKEEIAERELRKLVTRHFFLSCRECRRRLDRARTRYVWLVEGQRITVWLPAAISGRRRRKWLEEHVLAVEPSAIACPARVQELVDHMAPRPLTISMTTPDNGTKDLAASAEELPWALAVGLSVAGLAAAVAAEKAANIRRLRASVRRLGKSQLEAIILRIFTDLASDSYRPSEIGKVFGLSKSTMTRFASPNWWRSGGMRIPDLFANTAYVLAHHSAWMDAAEAAGVWAVVKKIITSLKGNDHAR